MTLKEKFTAAELLAAVKRKTEGIRESAAALVLALDARDLPRISDSAIELYVAGSGDPRPPAGSMELEALVETAADILHRATRILDALVDGNERPQAEELDLEYRFLAERCAAVRDLPEPAASPDTPAPSVPPVQPDLLLSRYVRLIEARAQEIAGTSKWQIRAPKMLDTINVWFHAGIPLQIVYVGQVELYADMKPEDRMGSLFLLNLSLDRYVRRAWARTDNAKMIPERDIPLGAPSAGSATADGGNHDRAA